MSGCRCDLYRKEIGRLLDQLRRMEEAVQGLADAWANEKPRMKAPERVPMPVEFPK